jgi:hypothetical protein
MFSLEIVDLNKKWYFFNPNISRFLNSASDPYSFFTDPDPDPQVEAGDQYGSGYGYGYGSGYGSGSNPDPGL